jgi:hypothetical protein
VDAFAIGAHAEDMEVRFHGSACGFRAVAEPLYQRDPVANTIELTVLRGGTLPEDADSRGRGVSRWLDSERT